MPKINDIQPGNCGTFSAEGAVGVVPGRSFYSQEEAGHHRTTDPGLSGSYQAHPDAGVRQGCQFERTTGRGNNLQKRKPENINAGLLTLATLVDLPVTISPHDHYNRSQGVITCPLLRNNSNQDMAEGLAECGVTAVYRIHRKENSNDILTDTLILTFNKSTPPDRIWILAGYSERVRPYIPLPRKCFRCQQYGHVTKNCKNSTYYVFHGRVTLFFANNYLTQCRITMKFLHNFF